MRAIETKRDTAYGTEFGATDSYNLPSVVLAPLLMPRGANSGSFAFVDVCDVPF